MEGNGVCARGWENKQGQKEKGMREKVELCKEGACIMFKWSIGRS